MLSSSVYDFLKLQAQIILPALGTFYFALAALWGLPNSEEVVGTIVAFDAFLGVLLTISTKQYNSDKAHDGFLDVTGVDQDTGHPDLKMTITKLPDELLSKKTVRLKVGPPPPHEP